MGEPLLSRPLRRVGWGLADQALSSLTNVGFTIVVARSLGIADFGAFGVAFTTYLLALGVGRALAGEPLLVAHSSGLHRARAGEAAGAALAVGAVAGCATAGAGLLVGEPLRSALLPMAVALPALLVQDAWRFVFLADGRPARAFLNDLVWVSAQAVAVGGVLVAGRASLATLTSAWAIAGVVAAVVGAVQLGGGPRLRSARRWLSSHRHLWPRFTAEFAATSGVWQVLLYGVGVLGGLPAVGAVRGAQVVVGPLHVLYLAAVASVVPEGIRLRQRSPERVLPLVRRLSLGLAGLALAWLAVGLLLPAGVGRALLGDTWAPARQVLAPFGLFMAGLGVVTGATAGLRIVGSAVHSSRAAVASAPVLLGAGLFGASVAGARGAAVALAVAGAGTAAIWWRSFGQAAALLEDEVDTEEVRRAVA